MSNFSKVGILILLISPAAWADENLFKHSNIYSSQEPKDQFGRSRQFDLQKLTLDVEIDLKKKKIAGTSTMVFVPLKESASTLPIDAVELVIESVDIDGAQITFLKTDEGLNIPIHPQRPTGKSFSVSIRYHGSPKKGLHFVAPDHAYPHAPWQAWTQGEAEDSRYWFPTYDYPNDKVQTETIVRVEKDFTVLSNGALIDTKAIGDKKQFHYRQTIPHVTYLVSVVAGQFEIVEDKAGKIPLQYYVPHGMGKRAQSVFGRTPAFVSFLEDVTGQPYPYEKYAQVVVSEFPIGGMENTTATTLTENVIYPEKDRESWDLRIDSLIAHELAHQWFGDLLTCESWNHLWLNEGFATYFAAWALEKTKSNDEFLFQMDQAAQKVFKHGDPRATVTYRFADPEELFDTNVYEKGAWIIHMLRKKLGEDLFLRGLKAYVREFAEKTVETVDFRRLFERQTGVNLSQFFQQWVYRPGWLTLTGRWNWDEESKTAFVELEQKTQIDGKLVLYTAELPIEIETKKGLIEQQITIEEKQTKVSFPLNEKPLTVRIDPQHFWLRSIDFDRSFDEIASDVRTNKSILIRLDAIRGLASQRSSKVTEVLGQTLRTDSFWGVRREAAKKLGEMGLFEAWDELLKSLKEPSPQVRVAIVGALAKDPRASTIQILTSIAQKDQSDAVVAEASYALASARRKQSFPLLEKLSTKPSHAEVIQTRILDGITAKGWEIGLALAMRKTRYGEPKSSRPSAVAALGAIGSYQEDRRDIFDSLISFLNDPSLKVRAASYRALGKLGESAAESLLVKASQEAIESEVREAARSALSEFREGINTVPQLRSLRKEFGELKENTDGLKRRIEFLEKLRPKASNSDKGAPEKDTKQE